MQDRIDQLRELLTEKEIEALLISTPENRRYMTGFTGTAGMVLITHKEAILITDFRYTSQAKAEAPDYKVVEFKKNKLKLVADLLSDLEIQKLGFESKHETYSTYLKYKDKLPVKLQATQNLVKKLRLTKDKAEISKLKEAIKLADQAFAAIKDQLKPGVKERDIALQLEFWMKEHGASKNAFDFIVASGERSALPHGVASEKEIEAGDFVTIDFGCVYQGYHSDMTRTVVIEEGPTDKQREIYQLVLKAQQEAIKAIKAGMKASEVDKVARDIIAEAGYGDYFGHGLGHGVGLEIHEGPRLSWQDDKVLKPGMVVTVEPGVYLPDWGGVRIEDIVVVQEDGCQILTQTPKELLTVGTK
ncbi:Xaa-Pro aminopeptidase [Halobacteroides halobius DSM 5150]|uniref:Xaa-Pro aminopeptidase n=1 Tax=Halobacteroides halobius (strain ATCC 35273 / DSM 5150 / MD-1) TaxID=748449 RepID=L0K824_HALHC|nr:Xaa-Pro peptidase family protein [Halobacteroides halobius]AGB40504.1 Xaa-Pro aminopeptidase [Halobacteroides halobius DSM 5150]